jgi:hypothetical protein
MGIRRPQLAALLLLSLCFVAAQEPAANKSPYEDMVETIRSGNTNINFRQLWLAYVAFHVRNPLKDTEPQKQAMNQALRDKNYQGAVKEAEEVLRKNFVDLDAHSVELTAYHEQQRNDLADVQNHILDGLRSSMTHVGDGKSVETAFEVRNIPEEYLVLRFAGLTPSKQSLVFVGGHSYDFLEAVDPKTGDKFKLYFTLGNRL